MSFTSFSFRCEICPLCVFGYFYDDDYYYYWVSDWNREGRTSIWTHDISVGFDWRHLREWSITSSLREPNSWQAPREKPSVFSRFCGESYGQQEYPRASCSPPPLLLSSTVPILPVDKWSLFSLLHPAAQTTQRLSLFFCSLAARVDFKVATSATLYR